ncbi:MAG: hypothetical protein IPM21_04085 [Acidobacteria bacterium]|nr:hypothetical protein [Acidobacteriota bacterium]
MEAVRYLSFSLPVLLSLSLTLKTQKYASAHEGFEGLSLQISSSKQSFVQLEPIPIIFKLRNNTNREIVGHANFRFSCNTVEIYVRDAQRAERKIKQLSTYRSRCVGTESPIPDGAHIDGFDVLKLDLLRYFDLPGHYQIRAVLKSTTSDANARSGWYDVTIAAPLANDLDALTFLQEETDTGRVFSEIDSKEREMIFEDFLAKYPDSPYSPYIRLNLAERHTFSGNRQNALVALEQLESVQNFIYAPRVKELLRSLR